MTGRDGVARDLDSIAIEDMAPLADIISSATIDGVPVLFAPQPGPVSAGLFFRVGWADETLATCGITHLVEHLALHDQGLSDVHHNGATSETYTHFHVTGSEREVVEYLNRVCAALRDLPLERLETEKEILQTEAASRPGAPVLRQRIERYGARGFGLAAYEGFGLSALSASDVDAWARSHFTRQNAVLWITTDSVPEGLELDLADGERFPVPHARDVITAKPAFYTGAPGGVLVDAVVPRSSAAVLFARVASKILLRRLRQESGLSYTAQCDYEPIDGERARISMFADALPEKQGAVVGTMIDVLAELCAGTFDAGDLESAKERTAQILDVPHPGAALLPSTALNLLTGAEIAAPDDLLQRGAAVTGEQIAEVARLMRDDALAQVPQGGVTWAGFTAVPTGSDAAVTGRTHPRFGDNEGALVIGQDGVTVRFTGGVITVRFDECVALEVWPDGGRRLTGADGFAVAIEPTLHANITRDVIARIDRSVPSSLHVPRPARPAEEIPQRPVVGPARPAAPRPGLGPWARIAGFGFAILAIACLLLAFVAAQSPDDATSSDAVAGGILVAAFVTAIAVGLLFGHARRVRWDRESSDAAQLAADGKDFLAR